VTSTPARGRDSIPRHREGRTNGATDWDVIVVGAGHNGLAAAALLAKRGLRVLCLEKNGYAGGMAGTREILSGCRNDVGASLLFPLAKGIAEELELERYGVETIELPIMAVDLNAKESPPAVFYASPLRMALSVLRHFGLGAMLGFVRLMAFCKYPASLMDRFTPRSVPSTPTSCSPARRTNAGASRSSSPSPAARWTSWTASCPIASGTGRCVRSWPSPRCSPPTRAPSRRAVRSASSTPSRRTRATG
jgi:phytoene dehydrogenase-like protein